MQFEIVSTKRVSKCKNCGMEIPAGTLKLRYYIPAGTKTIDASLCLQCLEKMLNKRGRRKNKA
jgi:hypothetical protein